MAIPTTRQEFTDFIMRRLGAPAITINLSEEQASDIIDQAIYYWQEFHMDGSNKTYYAYPLQQTDIDNKYITVPPEMIGVTRMFPIGQAISSDALFNMRYQFVMNDLYSLANVSLVPYYMTMMHIAQLEEVLVGQQPIRFNRHQGGIVYLDMDWSIACVGEIILVEGYLGLDPATYPDVWKDRWLQDYTTALMGRQWADNLSKFDVVMPAGMKINADKLYEKYNRKVEDMESKVVRDYGMPLDVRMG